MCKGCGWTRWIPDICRDTYTCDICERIVTGMEIYFREFRLRTRLFGRFIGV